MARRWPQDSTTATQTTTLAQRLYLFWNGSWATLITEAEPTPTPHAIPPDDTKLAQRVETFTQQGEVGRASATLTSPSKYTTSLSDL